MFAKKDKELFLNIRYWYSKQRKELITYFKTLCKHFKMKHDTSSVCIKILDRKINELPLKNFFGNEIGMHVNTIAVSIWVIINKYVEDDYVSICDISKTTTIKKNLLLKAEIEIFDDFKDISNWFKRPRSKTI